MEQVDATIRRNMMTLKALRHRAGFSKIEDAAKYLGLSTYRLARLEKDSSKINWQEIQKVSKGYDYPIDLIFFGDDVTFSHEIVNHGG
jgi:transcriptional regulator with XRE-family HTH domain